MELGCVATVDREGRTIWVVDAHPDDGIVYGETLIAAVPDPS